MLARAQTGTGKTRILFPWPADDRPPARARPERKPGARVRRGLVLVPTRQLALQVHKSLSMYGAPVRLQGAAIFGGVSFGPQRDALRRGVDTIIATPGRLLDHMQQRTLICSHVEMLDPRRGGSDARHGLPAALKRIAGRVPRQRQTLMFSATMPDPIRRLAEEWLTNPVSVATTPIATPAANVEHSVYFVQKKEKPRLLAELLQRTATERTLVFTRTKHGADKVVKHLMAARIRAAAIHGNKSQGARERVLEQFKSDRPPVLIATDIAARGLHITGISHVVNFDLPRCLRRTSTASAARPRRIVRARGVVGRARRPRAAAGDSAAADQSNQAGAHRGLPGHAHVRGTTRSARGVARRPDRTTPQRAGHAQAAPARSHGHDSRPKAASSARPAAGSGRPAPHTAHMSPPASHRPAGARPSGARPSGGRPHGSRPASPNSGQSRSRGPNR